MPLKYYDEFLCFYKNVNLKNHNLKNLNIFLKEIILF